MDRFKNTCVIATAMMVVLLMGAPAHAQNFANRLKDVAERAARSEVEREVDRQTRRVTRCMLGDDRCVQEAQRRGDQVEIVQAGSAPRPAVATPVAVPGHGHGASASQANAIAGELERDGRVILDGLQFATARATLRAESGATLDQVALVLRQQPQLRLFIVGHTDSTGSADSNQSLSQQRAESVRNALVGRGIAPARLTPTGVGSSTPVADNATERGRLLNRRVELVRQ